jgi:hypothetical protein
MAIKFENASREFEKKMNAPFSERELGAISAIEDIIDTKIIENFDGHSITVNAYDMRFIGEYLPRREKLMTQELFDRYKKAGWKIKFIEGEDDGINRSGVDTYVFSKL